jgi:E3 ubiquitin-protein ligase RFWD2
LRYGEVFNSLNIVSSVEFDKDEEYFASAGVSKQIKIFEYASVMDNCVGSGGSSLGYESEDSDSGLINTKSLCDETIVKIHSPIKEIPLNSKIR